MRSQDRAGPDGTVRPATWATAKPDTLFRHRQAKVRTAMRQSRAAAAALVATLDPGQRALTAAVHPTAALEGTPDAGTKAGEGEVHSLYLQAL